MKNIFLCLSFVLACATVFAQNTVSGTVVDSNSGEPLAFVTIYNLSTQKGTSTGSNGSFSIQAEEGVDLLKISYLGYQEQTITAKSSLQVSLTESPTSLDEVIVSANREEQKRSEAPIAIATVSPVKIEEMKATTIDQLLNQTAGVYMVDLGNEQHTMSIRRPIDYGASYLYLEDGIPIRASGVYNHNALLEINMANTSRIEIIRGPASSMYGSEAIGGAVNFISKKPSLKPTAGISIQGNDIGYKRTDFYASSTIADKVGIRVSGYYADQEDGVIEYSDFDKLALSLSANYYISDKTELVWNNTLIDYYSDMTGSLDSLAFYSESYESQQTFTNRQVNAYRTKLALNHYWNTMSKTNVTGYFRTNSVKQNPSYRVRDDYKPWIPAGDPNLAFGEINDNSFNSYGLIAQHKQDFDFLKSSLVAGGSLDYTPNTYEAEAIRIHKTDEGIYDSFTKEGVYLADYDADILNLAAYAQYKVSPVRGLNIIAGLRYDYFDYKFDNHLDANAFTAVLDGNDVFNRVTPKVGATYDYKNRIGAYANYSQGFVPPQVTELYRGQQVALLDPTSYENHEFGSWFSFAKHKIKLEASVYRMDGTDEIISVLQLDGSTQRMNAGKTRHEGIEYALNIFPHKDVAFRFSGTNANHEFIDFVESGNDYSGKQMPQAPKWIANSEITYRPSYFKRFRVGVEWQHIDNYYMDAANTKTYEGYDIFNVRLGYEWRSFEIWSNIMNISDELYATVARANQWGQSYSLGKPRNVNVGIAYKFK